MDKDYQKRQDKEQIIISKIGSPSDFIAKSFSKDSKLLDKIQMAQTDYFLK